MTGMLDAVWRTFRFDLRHDLEPLDESRAPSRAARGASASPSASRIIPSWGTSSRVFRLPIPMAVEAGSSLAGGAL